MNLFDEVQQPCIPPLEWLEDAHFIAYKFASGEYESGKLDQANLSREVFSMASSPDIPAAEPTTRTTTTIRVNLNHHVEGKKTGKKSAKQAVFGQTSVQMTSKKSNVKGSYDTNVTTTVGANVVVRGRNGLEMHRPVGTGKMYAKANSFKHNQHNKIAASTDKPNAKKPGMS